MEAEISKTMEKLEDGVASFERQKNRGRSKGQEEENNSAWEIRWRPLEREQSGRKRARGGRDLESRVYGYNHLKESGKRKEGSGF